MLKCFNCHQDLLSDRHTFFIINIFGKMKLFEELFFYIFFLMLHSWCKVNKIFLKINSLSCLHESYVIVLGAAWNVVDEAEATTSSWFACTGGSSLLARKMREPDTLVKKVFAFVRAIDRFTRIPPLWGIIRHESRRWEVNNNRSLCELN